MSILKNKSFIITCVSLSFCCSVLLLAFFIASFWVFDAMLDKGMNESLVMTKDNVDIWGNLPGEYDVFVSRNLTFYSIQNPESLTDPNTKPILKQTEPVYFKETAVLTDITIGDNGNTITYVDNIPVEIMPGNETLLEQEVTFPNFLALGAWTTALTIPAETSITATLATLYFSLTKQD